MVIDKYLNKLASVEVTDAQIKALVDAITDFASKKDVSTKDYSGLLL